MSYINFTSLTWWTGVIAIVLGTAGIFVPENAAAAQFGEVIGVLIGSADTAPAQLIVTGLGIIGIRAKMERG